jgi:hypothetical protein
MSFLRDRAEYFPSKRWRRKARSLIPDSSEGTIHSCIFLILCDLQFKLKTYVKKEQDGLDGQNKNKLHSSCSYFTYLAYPVPFIFHLPV